MAACTELAGCRNTAVVRGSHPREKRHVEKSGRSFGHPFLCLAELLLNTPEVIHKSHLLSHRCLLAVAHCRVLSTWVQFSSAHGCLKAKGGHCQVFVLRNQVLDRVAISIAPIGKAGQTLLMPLNHLHIVSKEWKLRSLCDDEQALLSIGLFL